MKGRIFAILLLAGALPLAGDPTLAEQWAAGLKEVDQKLRAQQWEPAEKQVLRLGDQIVAGTGTGQGAGDVLAVAAAFRAIAEAGQGRQEEAGWHWDMALNLLPDIGKTDLSPYGAVAAELKTRQLRPVDPDRLKLSLEGVKSTEQEAIQKHSQPPRIIRKVRPRFPKGLRQMGVAGNVRVEVIIGEDGVPREPLVVDAQGGGPAMKYVALEALRQWRFEPGRQEGEPVKVYYILNINFKYKT
jgi:TonB family protein